MICLLNKKVTVLINVQVLTGTFVTLYVPVTYQASNGILFDTYWVHS